MKKNIFVIITLSIIILIIILDFMNVKFNNKHPLIAIKFENKEQQKVVYNALFYKVIICTAEENNYLITSYFYKENENLCPKKYNIKFKNGYFINKNNIKIEKDLFQKLQEFYSYEEINNMTNTELRKALEQLNNHIPITNK